MLQIVERLKDRVAALNPKNLKGKLSTDGVLKLCADAILINVSVIGALILTLLYRIAYSPQANIDAKNELWNYWQVYNDSAWLLTLICLVVFSLYGFYTRGRFYRGRYKTLVVMQAVSTAYLIFGALTFLSQGIFFNFLKNYLIMSRGALMASWVLSMVLLVVARAWSSVWRRMLRVEHQKQAPEAPKVRRALIIGGAGYIGSALVPRLLEQGYLVRVLDLLIYGVEPLRPWLGDPRLEVVQADFRQIDSVVSAMQDVDAVIHLGAIVGDPACALDEGLTTEINLVATRMIAEIAKGYGVRYFVFASTCSVYGASDTVLDEHAPLKPVSLYARSKVASEKVLLQMADEKFSPVILRLSTVYGLSGRYRFDLVVNLLTAKALIDGEITIFGGSQWRSFVHVEDAARSIVHVLAAPVDAVRGQVFNVGSDEQNYSIAMIGEMIQRCVPTAKMINKGDEVDPNNYKVGFAKIRKVLGFLPEWTVERGIQQVIEAVQSGKVTDYRAPQYSNIKFLTMEGITRLDRHENGWASRLINEVLETEI
jgi:nucleoside-diphosphate-sugar epimerase